MLETWVGKLEAISLFKVTDRTLDNWVKAGRIRKERRRGQIIYEISQVLEETGTVYPPPETPPVAESAQKATETEAERQDSAEEAENELFQAVDSAEIQVLQARLDEKNIQIAQLSDSLEKRQKDLNTLVLERGVLSEKSNQLLLETESLRKDREKLLKENEIISEKSFRRTSVYSLSFSFFVAVFTIIFLIVFKHRSETELTNNKFQSEKDILTNNVEKLEIRADKEAKLAEDERNRALLLQKDKDELNMKLSEAKQKETLMVQKASEASERVSEIKREKENFQKELENQQKMYNQQILELNELKIKLQIIDTMEQNKKYLDKDNKKTEESIRRSIKEKLTESREKPIENKEKPSENINQSPIIAPATE